MNQPFRDGRGELDATFQFKWRVEPIIRAGPYFDMLGDDFGFDNGRRNMPQIVMFFNYVVAWKPCRREIRLFATTNRCEPFPAVF